MLLFQAANFGRRQAMEDRGIDLSKGSLLPYTFNILNISLIFFGFFMAEIMRQHIKFSYLKLVFWGDNRTITLILRILILLIGFTIYVLYRALLHKTTKEFSLMISQQAPMKRLYPYEKEEGAKYLQQLCDDLYFSQKQWEDIVNMDEEIKLRLKLGLNNSILLVGDSGTGKTEIAKMLCGLNGGGYLISLGQLVQYKELGFKILIKLFSLAKKNNWTLIFDDGDLGLIDRDLTDMPQHVIAIINYILYAMGCNSHPIIFTVNKPIEQFDKSFSRRFQDHYSFALPSIEECKNIIKIYVESEILQYLEIDEIAGLMQNMSRRDMNVFAKKINMYYRQHQAIDNNVLISIYNSFAEKIKNYHRATIFENHKKYLAQYVDSINSGNQK